MAEKICSQCKQAKKLKDFYRYPKSRSHYGDGYLSKCIECTLAYNKKTLKHNVEYTSKLKKKYGITAEDYEALLVKQNHGCKICGKTEEKNGRRLAVDHCHENGYVRGLLCSNCNKGLGCFQDDTDRMRVAMTYLTSSGDWLPGLSCA